jgi:hypothetical protein
VVEVRASFGGKLQKLTVDVEVQRATKDDVR